MRQSTIRVLTLLDDGQTFDLCLPHQGDRLATLDSIRLRGLGAVSSSLLIALTARFESTARNADCAAAPSGTSGRTSQRLWWIGNAPSRWVRARLRRGDRHVDWRLSIHPSHIEELSISARVDRMECLPGPLESAFGAP